MMYKLQKSLYGLEKAPRKRYKKFDRFMDRSGFLRCQVDHDCYVKRFDNSYIILLLYVDDILIVRACKMAIDKLTKEFLNEFAMKDLGAAKQIFGMRIT